MWPLCMVLYQAIRGVCSQHWCASQMMVSIRLCVCLTSLCKWIVWAIAWWWSGFVRSCLLYLLATIVICRLVWQGGGGCLHCLCVCVDHNELVHHSGDYLNWQIVWHQARALGLHIDLSGTSVWLVIAFIWTRCGYLNVHFGHAFIDRTTRFDVSFQHHYPNVHLPCNHDLCVGEHWFTLDNVMVVWWCTINLSSVQTGRHSPTNLGAIEQGFFRGKVSVSQINNFSIGSRMNSITAKPCILLAQSRALRLISNIVISTRDRDCLFDNIHSLKSGPSLLFGSPKQWVVRQDFIPSFFKLKTGSINQ